MAVVVGFGTTLFLRVRYAILEQVDADLLGAAQVVAAKLQQSGSAEQLEIPEAYRYRFGEAPADAPYLVVWDADGRVEMASDNTPADLRPVPEPPAAEGTHPYDQRSRGPFRELIVRGPSGSQVLVGRQIGRERNEFIRLFWWLFGAGLGIVVLGLTWAWFLSRRILAPIEQMSNVAARISASNLSDRIDKSRTVVELSHLAQVLNQMFERLQESFLRQARFTADASHELRTPTAVIVAQAELALAKRRSPEEYEEALRACYRAGQRMDSLVNGLLTLARIDAGQPENHPEPVDLQQEVEQAMELLTPLADQKRIEVRCDLHMARVAGNAEQLGQVVANLLDNAITYNHEGGQVELRLVADESDAVLSVSDTGIGIGEHDLPRIFERFYRVNEARTGGSGGVGLGLSICQEIVRSHGGTIDATSEVGKSTTFTVRLPLLAPLVQDTSAECANTRARRSVDGR